MSAQNPVTKTSFESEVGERGEPRTGDLAALEVLLAEARDARIPVLRRLRLVATLARRLDSFFQLQVPALRSRGRLAQVRARTSAIAAGTRALLESELLPALASRGLRLSSWDALAAEQRVGVSRLFAAEVSPLLTPLTVDAGHPFPCVASLALNLAVMARAPREPELRYVGIEVPPTLPRFVALAGGGLVLRIEDVIGANLGTLLPGLEVASHHVFRVTRDGRPRRSATTWSSDAGGPSPRTRAAVRLELEAAALPALRQLLTEALGLHDDEVYEVAGALDLCGLASLPVARALHGSPAGLARAAPRLSDSGRGSA
jgi:polyphosphate kinase